MIPQRDEQQALNEKHAHDPQPGDAWFEMCCGSCVVLARIGSKVIFTKGHKPTGPDHWTWDLDAAEMMSVADFERWLAHKSIPGYWTDVNPGRHKWAADAFSAQAVA